MNRLDARFEALVEGNRKALVPYLTAGAPSPECTVPTLRALAEAGADVIELGMPFSDPMADGPVIQQACEKALAHGMNVKRVLEQVREFRAHDGDTPLVLMGYLNPVDRFGVEAFARQAADAGADGVLVVDLPPEEGEDIVEALGRHNLRLIRLVAPTTGDERMARICAAASGFVYYVALKGVTGAANLDRGSVRDNVERLRRHTDLPIAVGFGVSDAESAAAIAALADAVVVGSALVALLNETTGPDQAAETARAFLAPLRRAIDGAVVDV